VVASKFSRRSLFAAAMALLCILAVAKFRPRTRAFAVSDTHRINSLAVLPLRNLSADSEQQYFSDGMTDELITAIAKSTGLRVISHTSVYRYEDTKRPLPDIAKELAVDAIVEGTVMRSGDRVRITAQLIDAHSDQHVWAESYEGELRDVLGLQDRVAREVANEIGSKLAIRARLPVTPKVDPAAYEAYLRGMFAFGQMRCTSFGKALGYFQEAVRKDTSFAPAYAGLADSYFELSDWRCSQTASFDKAQASALKAVALDPSLADAHAVLAEIAFARDWSWTNAASEFEKAIQLDPNDAAIRASYALLLDLAFKQVVNWRRSWRAMAR
jgi:TolB-like protein